MKLLFNVVVCSTINMATLLFATAMDVRSGMPRDEMFCHSWWFLVAVVLNLSVFLVACEVLRERSINVQEKI